MIRILFIWTLSAAFLAAQDKPVDSLSDRQKEADKKGADWDALAKGLETKISRLLPCDARVRSAIEDVGRASELRMTALRAYLEAAAAKAKEDAEATQLLVAGHATLVTQMNAERVDAEQAREGIEGQLMTLGPNVARRATLGDAQSALAIIAEAARVRVVQSQDQATRSEALAGLLKELDAAYQSRQKALEAEVAALATEAARWNGYYTARVTRSITECSITNITVAPAPRPAQGKKK